MVISDSEIILKIKQGEINYYSSIVEKYMPNIIRYIKAKLFNKLDVDDLVQNTFINFYKSINNFDSEKPISPYLYKIASNELKMYYRAHKSTVTLDEKYNISYDPSFFIDDYSPYTKLLTQEQQTILKLLQAGHTYQEIANKIKKPINTVRTIIRRTRLLFKKKYEQS